MNDVSTDTAETEAPSSDEVFGMHNAGDAEVVLEVNNLATHFHTRSGVVKAVDGISFSVRAGEVLGIVGESGCGKSVTSLSLLGLVPKPGKIESGEVLFKGTDLLKLSDKQLAGLRGESLSMIFQQPQSSLNPVQRVGDQISEVHKIHRKLSKEVGRERATEALARVGIPDAERRSKAYPHEMSGGMAQRVMIAMALALEPEVLIADEPTTALDVTIQAQILDLMRGLQNDTGAAVILITHDLGVVAEMCDRVAVMYAGQIVEMTDVHTLFNDPKHPYTKGLIASIPVLGESVDELETIPGVVPQLVDLPIACRFADRCGARIEAGLEICQQQVPDLIDTSPGHQVRCFLHSRTEGQTS